MTPSTIKYDIIRDKYLSYRPLDQTNANTFLDCYSDIE
jgi:hypothetical protein